MTSLYSYVSKTTCTSSYVQILLCYGTLVVYKNTHLDIWTSGSTKNRDTRERVGPTLYM